MENENKETFETVENENVSENEKTVENENAAEETKENVIVEESEKNDEKENAEVISEANDVKPETTEEVKDACEAEAKEKSENTNEVSENTNADVIETKDNSVTPAKDSSKSKINGKKAGAIVGAAAVVVVIVILVVLLLVVGLVLFLNRRTKVNPTEYIVFEESGYDGYGTATFSFDEDKFIEDYPKIRIKNKEVKMLLERELKEYYSGVLSDENVEELVDEILAEAKEEKNGNAELLVTFFENGTLSKDSKLSLGEEITYSFEFTEEEMEKAFKVKLKDYGDINHTVTGLTPVEKFDAFENVEISFTGYAPNGRASINGGDYSFGYVLDKYEGLSNGDVVTVDINIYGGEELYVKDTGRIPQEMSKKFTVEGLPEFLDSASNLSPELIESMNNQAYDKIKANAANSSPYKAVKEVESINYLGNYFLKNKDTSSQYNNNVIYMIYKIRYKYTITDNKKNEQVRYVEAYNYVKFENIVIEADGKQTVDLNNASMETWDSFQWETDVVESKIFGTTYYHDYYITGYSSIDNVYSEVVTKNIDDFNHEDSVVDIELGDPVI